MPATPSLTSLMTISLSTSAVVTRELVCSSSCRCEGGGEGEGRGGGGEGRGGEGRGERKCPYIEVTSIIQ